VQEPFEIEDLVEVLVEKQHLYIDQPEVLELQELRQELRLVLLLVLLLV
jgi:hypothetical protein